MFWSFKVDLDVFLYHGIGGLIFYNLLIYSLRICNFTIFQIEE